MSKSPVELFYLQALSVLLLLFVYDAQAEVDLIGFFKVWLHIHHLGKCFFRMLKRPITIIEYSNTIPKLWFLSLVSIAHQLSIVLECMYILLDL